MSKGFVFLNLPKISSTFWGGKNTGYYGERVEKEVERANPLSNFDGN